MRRAGALLRQVLDAVSQKVAPGITTGELDSLAHQLIKSGGAKPAFLGYRGYPAVLCTSVNEQVVHGIPGPRQLLEGDIVSIDCGLFLGGFCSDMAVTLPVGAVTRQARELMHVTRTCLERGIAAMVVGNRIGDVSSAVQEYAEAHEFGVVREYTGHGIGREMHEPPQVLNYGTPGTGVRLRAGMVFAIEPMINSGTWKTKTLSDGWTVITADNSLSAHFEHTVAITADGPAILTA